MIRKIALSGFGAIAENAHLPVLAEKGVSVEAVHEPSPIRGEAARRCAPKARVYANLEELLACEKSLDAVVVCSPPKYHADAVVKSLAAGFHVLCEKPLTLDLDAFKAIEAAAKASRKAVWSINNWAYSPQWSALLKLVADGRLGKIRSARIEVLRTKPSVSALPGDWRKDPAVSGGGILVDHGWHNLYLLRGLLGETLELVETRLQPLGLVDEEADLLLRSEGAEGRLHMTWRAKSRANTAFVAGEKGTASLEDDRLVVKAGGREETLSFPEKLSAGSAHPEWLAAMWPAFEDACARGAGNLDEAAFCLRTIRAAYGAPEAAAR
ncbi:MAG: Gfo/Idh/MocA family oxidoreductase [Elusimicrobiota bacterium]|nr:Gfo/Idh/MocA family oxidoreductase [Elusimicrobiota bacterium]